MVTRPMTTSCPPKKPVVSVGICSREYEMNRMIKCIASVLLVALVAHGGPPVITGARGTENALHLTFTGEPNQPYTVESAASVSGPWAEELDAQIDAVGTGYQVTIYRIKQGASIVDLLIARIEALEAETDALRELVDAGCSCPMTAEEYVDLMARVDALERAQPVCGNGVREAWEECDDGNTLDGDGCSADCQLEATCGDGTREGSEECDDGNTMDGDGCSADCQLEANCGDGVWKLGGAAVDGLSHCA